MSCRPTNTPQDIDVAALVEKYNAFRDQRMRQEGQRQYVRPSGGAVQAYSVDPHQPLEPRDALSEELDVVVLGAGWGGILASYHLMEEGVTNIRNIDTAGDFGGVWYWNRYPGIQCDNDAYCYLPLLEETGFMPSKKFTDGEEIYQYAKHIADRYGFADKALFHTQITELRWDDNEHRWQIKTNRGDDLRARFVVMACGVLNMPKLPGIQGIDEFQGKLFHTARWDYRYTGGSYNDNNLSKLADKRVAIVGTGATAVQAVPHLARHAKHLYVVQRTPSSIDERPNPLTDEQWFKSLQQGWQADRRSNFQRAAQEFLQPGEPDLICDIWTEINRNLNAELEAEGWPQLSLEEMFQRKGMVNFKVMERLRQRVAELVEDPDTAEALKPYYHFLCKRPLSSDEFYPVFNRPNVDLIDVSETKGLQQLTETGFVANGQEFQADCIIFASGFEVTSELERRWGIDVIQGRDGVSLYDHWRDGPVTLHGTMTHNFPNQFYIGYIQGALNASVTEQFGQQGRHSAYIIGEALRRGITAVEPTQQAQDAYVQRFNDIAVDLSEFQAACPPSYFTNEGVVNDKWSLFRGWGHGWDAFQQMVQAWRDAGDFEGMETRQRAVAEQEIAS